VQRYYTVTTVRELRAVWMVGECQHFPIWVWTWTYSIPPKMAIWSGQNDRDDGYGFPAASEPWDFGSSGQVPFSSIPSQIFASQVWRNDPHRQLPSPQSLRSARPKPSERPQGCQNRAAGHALKFQKSFTTVEADWCFFHTQQRV
jgi:hypothetical protein